MNFCVLYWAPVSDLLPPLFVTPLCRYASLQNTFGSSLAGTQAST